MPIKSISKVYRPVRAGKVHLGIKVKTNKPCKCKKKTSDKKPAANCTVCRGTGFIFIPREVNYFVLKDAPELIEFYPEEPKELRIAFPGIKLKAEGEMEETLEMYLEKIFPQYLKRYSRSGLQCKGNEETATKVNAEAVLEETECPCKYLETGECKRDAIFRFRTRDIPSLNIYQIRTSSSNSIKNLNSGIRDLIEHCAINRIDPSLVKLVLRRIPQTVSRLADGVQRQSTHHIMQIDLDPKHYESIEQVREKAVSLFLPREQRELLPAPDESRDELFHPEAQVAEAQVEIQKEEEVREEEKAIKEFFPLTDTEIENCPKEDLKVHLLELAAHFTDKGGSINKNSSDKILQVTEKDDIKTPYVYFRTKLNELTAGSKTEKPGKNNKPAKNA